MKLRDVLTEKELEKVKYLIKKEIDKDPTNWLHGIKIKTFKDYYKDLEKLDDSESLLNICSVIRDKKILSKIQKHIKE